MTVQAPEYMVRELSGASHLRDEIAVSHGVRSHNDSRPGSSAQNIFREQTRCWLCGRLSAAGVCDAKRRTADAQLQVVLHQAPGLPPGAGLCARIKARYRSRQYEARRRRRGRYLLWDFGVRYSPPMV